jgi:excisionase family DNA binding protein
VLLSVPEVAKRLRTDVETVQRWIREGHIPAHDDGAQLVIKDDDIETYAVDDDVIPSNSAAEPFWGGPMPNWVRLVREDRESH